MSLRCLLKCWLMIGASTITVGKQHTDETAIKSHLCVFLRASNSPQTFQPKSDLSTRRRVEMQHALRVLEHKSGIFSISKPDKDTSPAAAGPTCATAPKGWKTSSRLSTKAVFCSRVFIKISRFHWKMWMKYEKKRNWRCHFASSYNCKYSLV